MEGFLKAVRIEVRQVSVGRTLESLVYVWLASGKGAMISNARIETLGDRAFITGRMILHSLGPRDGLNVWYPISDVAALTEYPDEETARRCAEQAKKRGDRTNRSVREGAS